MHVVALASIVIEFVQNFKSVRLGRLKILLISLNQPNFFPATILHCIVLYVP